MAPSLPVIARVPHTVKHPPRCPHCGSTRLIRKGTRLKKLEIAPFGKGVLRILGESAYTLIKNGPLRAGSHRGQGNNQGQTNGNNNHVRGAVRIRPQRAVAQGGYRINHRHRNRVVRLFPLWNGCRAYLWQAILSWFGSVNGDSFIGFVGRPIGAAIFGHYGDRIGRKATLIATLLCMGIATFLIAFVPTYESIGIWGAVILTVLRVIQGIGVGGEWGGSVLLAMEWSRHHGQRGLVASWPQFGVPCGLFLANLALLVFSQMSGDQFAAWGWRMPFALSIILVGIVLWIRLGILETPVFQQLLKENKIERAPVIAV